MVHAGYDCLQEACSQFIFLSPTKALSALQTVTAPECVTNAPPWLYDTTKPMHFELLSTEAALCSNAQSVVHSMRARSNASQPGTVQQHAVLRMMLNTRCERWHSIDFILDFDYIQTLMLIPASYL